MAESWRDQSHHSHSYFLLLSSELSKQGDGFDHNVELQPLAPQPAQPSPGTRLDGCGSQITFLEFSDEFTIQKPFTPGICKFQQ
jgi:hypothetical protein